MRAGAVTVKFRMKTSCASFPCEEGDATLASTKKEQNDVKNIRVDCKLTFHNGH
jgi:hypothetical protein